MELKSFTPEMSKSYSLFDTDEVLVLPIGDIQYSDEQQTDVKRLRKFIQWGLDHDAYFLGMGDYIDIASPKNRALIMDLRARAYDSVKKMLDDAAVDIVEEIYEILRPTTGRWLGLLKGHHYYEFSNGRSTDALLAEKLSAPLLGNCAALALRLEDKPWSRAAVAWIWAHHGAGGGITPGAALNRLRPIVETFKAHVYLMGHQHRTSVYPLPEVSFGVDRYGKVRMYGTKRFMISVGGFLRGYEAGSVNLAGEVEGGYVEKGMYAPVQLGSAILKFRPVKERDITRVDIGCELL